MLVPSLNRKRLIHKHFASNHSLLPWNTGIKGPGVLTSLLAPRCNQSLCDLVDHWIIWTLNVITPSRRIHMLWLLYLMKLLNTTIRFNHCLFFSGNFCFEWLYHLHTWERILEWLREQLLGRQDTDTCPPKSRLGKRGEEGKGPYNYTYI